MFEHMSNSELSEAIADYANMMNGGYLPAHMSRMDAMRGYARARAERDSRAEREVNVPTGLAAVVSLSPFPDDPAYILTREGWRGLRTYNKYDPSDIADRLREGGRVLFEGLFEGAERDERDEWFAD